MNQKTIIKVRPLMSEGMVGIELELSLLALQELATVNENILDAKQDDRLNRASDELISAGVSKTDVRYKRELLRQVFSFVGDDLRDDIVEELWDFFLKTDSLVKFINKLTGDVPSRQDVSKALFD